MIKTQKMFVLLILLIPMLACGLLPTSRENPEQIPSKEIEIAADQGWQDTGIAFQSGEQVLIEYVSGQVQDQETKIIDGTGSDYVCGHAGCCEPMPTAPRSALIGKIGSIDDGMFLVGNGINLPVEISGTLFLRINDCNSGLEDNSGQFQVQITRK
jgi:hypothetical protein